MKRKTFYCMIESPNQEELKQKKYGGKPNILSVEDRLLMALEYLREYRTYFHVSQSYESLKALAIEILDGLRMF